MDQTYIKDYISLCKKKDYNLINQIAHELELFDVSTVAQKYNVSESQVNGVKFVHKHPYLLDETETLPNLEYVYKKYHNKSVHSSESSEGGGGLGALGLGALKKIAQTGLKLAKSKAGKFTVSDLGKHLDKGIATATKLAADPKAAMGEFKKLACNCDAQLKAVKDKIKADPKIPKELKDHIVLLFKSVKAQHGGSVSLDNETTNSSSFGLTPTKLGEINEFR